MKIWIISGCSSGLGKCWTRSILEDEQNLVIGITRNSESVTSLFQDFSERFIPCIADVNDEKGLKNKLIRLVQKYGSPHYVITAAGYPQFGTIEDLSNQEICQQFETNVIGSINVIRPVLPYMKDKIDSRILLISSMAGVSCWPLLGAYQMSKHAIEALAETLRLELEEFNIQVGVLQPGPYHTKWSNESACKKEVSETYNSAELYKRARCGYTIEETQQSLPFFWAMFREKEMPKRIVSSCEFAQRAITEAKNKIIDWKKNYEI